MDQARKLQGLKNTKVISFREKIYSEGEKVRAERLVGTTAYRVKIDEGRGYIEIARRSYPLYPYGNYVEDRAEIYADEDGKEVVLLTVRDSWGGTGREDHGRIALSDDEYNNIKLLATKLFNYLSEENYDEITKTFGELTGYIEKLMTEREEQIDQAFDEFFEKMEELAIEDEKLRFIKDAEYIREQIKECVLEHIN